MAENGSDCSSLSSVTDDESVYSSYDSLVSEDIGADRFPSLSLDTKLLPYWFEPESPPEPTTDVLLVTDREDEPSSQMSNTNW